jgi:hypothetical protein
MHHLKRNDSNNSTSEKEKAHSDEWAFLGYEFGSIKTTIVYSAM